ncbi:S41 family peptidase [Namhaeicola litoreus]|uniref:S41 family peptidase n=1 Tax=Namhaeicola litoreus TaxID=1052145 RepID=A0ABW3Y2V5_9FLAO
MKSNIKFSVSIFSMMVALWLTSCGGDDNDPTVVEPPIASKNTEIQDFIWQGMNEIYYWQDNVPNLADNKFASQDAYKTFLESEDDPFVFFDNLLYQKNVVDRFSWIVDDYVELENSFQGISTTDGIKFGVAAYGENGVFGYVRYVLPNSDASKKEIKRGDIFTHVNGVAITRSNYVDLLYESSSTSHTLSLAKIENNTITPTGVDVELSKSVLTENPVYLSKSFTIDGKKIGYIMYNRFNDDFDDEINRAFGELKAEGVTDLVLDFRYNPGGSVNTAVSIASMITGQYNGEILLKEKWNRKYQAYWEANRPDYLISKFPNRLGNGNLINSLELNSIYILTTGNTASASELIINGLKPYINVKLIGQKTYGKSVASVTLYDSNNFGKEGANPNHKYAMQPIILETRNKLDENDIDGFDPDFEIAENIANLGTLGDTDEPLLQAAINMITGRAMKMDTQKFRFADDLLDAAAIPNYRNDMYLELDNEELTKHFSRTPLLLE